VTVSVPVGVAAPVTVIFPSVATAGQVSVTPVPAASAAPPATNFHVVGSDYYNITPTATFSGRVRVTLPYDPAVVGSQASDLRLMHFNTHVDPAAWEDITVSVDTVNHTVTGETTSFSDFGLFLPDGTGSGASNVPASSNWSLLLIVAGALGTVALRRRAERRMP
jgi:hypothetical protein